ncbi:hypothetical protein HDU86_006319 [Geranomyces michiganensis]|nr:hypothetical protein HDU86_006319 [Geranomyces michiganensis]
MVGKNDAASISTPPSASLSRTASPLLPEAAVTAAADGPTRKGRGPFRSPGPPQKPGRGERKTRDPPVRVYPSRKPVPGRENGPVAGSGGSGAADETECRARGGEIKKNDMRSSRQRPKAGKDGLPVGIIADGVQALFLDGDGGANSAAGESASEDEWDPDLPPISKDTPKPVVPPKTRRPLGDYTEESNTCALDVYDFPSSFKAHDLDLIFEGQQGGRRGGYTIKWMGDTRAVIVFQHPDTAKAAYAHALGNPFIRIKPYAGEITRDSTDHPRIPAPVRSDMVARRLVAGALGMRSPRRTAEEVGEDKRKLQDAKDKIRAEQAQKTAREALIQAAWES